jgi:hypothetical protein
VPTFNAPVVVAFVVVEFPTMVKFPIWVDEAVEMKPWRVGKVEKTRFPALPVSSVKSDASSAEVSIEVLETLLLKTDQSAATRQPLVEAVAASQVTAFTVRVRPEEKESTFS